MKPIMRTLFIFILVLAVFAGAGSASAEQAYVALEKRLTAEQVAAAGLNKLSSQELAALNSLLRDEQAAMAQAVKPEKEKRQSGAWFGGGGAAPIVSTLKGDFRGWKAGTVFELENGQTWRVIEGDYYVGKPLQGLEATVRPGKISGWYMKVEGHNPSAKVQRQD